MKARGFRCRHFDGRGGQLRTQLQYRSQTGYFSCRSPPSFGPGAGD
jgi:hypothetical protein